MLAMFAFRELFVKQGVRYNGIDYSSGVANMRPMAPRIRRPLLLRQWRKHRGLTQDKLAEMLGTTKGHISELETGKRRYNQQHLEALAEALMCDPVDLLIRDPTDPKGIWLIWDQVPSNAQPQARAVLETFARPFDHTGAPEDVKRKKG